MKRMKPNRTRDDHIGSRTSLVKRILAPIDVRILNCDGSTSTYCSETCRWFKDNEKRMDEAKVPNWCNLFRMDLKFSRAVEGNRHSVRCKPCAKAKVDKINWGY